MDESIFAPVNTFSLDTASPILLGRRCEGDCDDGNPEQAYYGQLDEIHFDLSPSLPVDGSFVVPHEAEASDSTLFLFGMNEPVGGDPASEGIEQIVVDRGPDARHGESVETSPVVAQRQGCFHPSDYAPSPGGLLLSPQDGSFYPGTNVGCTEDTAQPALDPEGYPVSTSMEWLIGGVYDPLYDGESEYTPASDEGCGVVQCRLSIEDVEGNETSVLGTFHPRELGEGGHSTPQTNVEAQAGIADAVAPLVAADEQQGWTLSFWYRFHGNPIEGSELVVGDDPQTVAPDAFASWISFKPEIQKEFHHMDEEVSHYRYRCGLRMKSSYQLFSAVSDSHDHFVAGVDVVLASPAVDPCVTQRWYQLVVMRQGLKMWILGSSWGEGETAPTPHEVLWQGEDTGNNLVLPYVVDPGLVIRGFGDEVILDELHLSTGLSYLTEGGMTPLVPDEPGPNTRILWNMEPLSAEDPSTLQDLGPFEIHGVKEDSAAIAAEGITNLCNP